MGTYKLKNDSGTVAVTLSVDKAEYNDYIRTPEAQRVSEVWDLNVMGASDWTDVEAERVKIQKAMFEADRAIMRRRQSDYVWLEHTRPDDSMRRTLVYGGDVVLPNKSGDPYCGDIVKAVWSFERHPRTELVAPAGGSPPPPPASNVVLLDGTPFDITTIASGLGTVAPARIGALQLVRGLAPSGPTGPILSEGWIGIQPKYEDGGVFSPFIDMGASVASISFTNAIAHAERGVRTIQEDVAAVDLGAYRGRFRILLRIGRTAGPSGELSEVTLQAKMDSAQTEKLTFKFGGESAATGSRYVDLGELSIPSIGPFDHVLGGSRSNYQELLIRLYAGCADQSVVLAVDQICLMPADNVVRLSDFVSDPNGGAVKTIEVRQGPDEDLFAFSSDTVAPQGAPEYEANVDVAGWNLPPEGGWLVCVMQGGADVVPSTGGSHVAGVERDMVIDAWPRFFNL